MTISAITGTMGSVTHSDDRRVMVSAMVHREAKVAAARMGMTLRDYVDMVLDGANLKVDEIKLIMAAQESRHRNDPRGQATVGSAVVEALHDTAKRISA